MWSAACKGVSPSVREILRGSAPLVKRRKARSKSLCFMHTASGVSWLLWRPSSKAGGGREKDTVSHIPAVGLFLPFSLKRERVRTPLQGPPATSLSGRQGLPSAPGGKACPLQVSCSWASSPFPSLQLPLPHCSRTIVSTALE